jgi:hypothetical protein
MANANAPELAHVGIFPNDAGRPSLSIMVLGAEEHALTLEILVNSLVDLGDYVDPNTGRQGRLFRLNGNELKLLRWGDGEDAYPEISYQTDEFKLHHIFDTGHEGENLSYAGLVAHFQAHLAPEEMAGGRRRSSRKRRRNHRRTTKAARRT